MFNRGLYKKNALKCLRDRRPVPTLVSLVVLVTYFLLNAGSVGKSITAVGPHLTLILDARKMNFIVIAIMCFVLGTIEIAEAGFYLFAVDHPQEQLSFNIFIEGFSLFVRGSLAFIWKWFWIFIWGLFFVVPGIIKFFSYSQFFYILRDYPQIGIRQALAVSKEITKGHKADLFWLYLSFIGWDLLSIPTAFILQLWIRPYKQASFAFAYRSLMQKALTSGAVVPDDLK